MTPMTPFAHLEKFANDDSTGRKIVRHGLNAGGAAAGGYLGAGLGAVGSALAAMQVYPPNMRGQVKIPKSAHRAALLATLASALVGGGGGYGIGRGINAGIDAVSEKSAGLNVGNLMSTFRGLGRSGIGDKLTRFGKGMARVPGSVAGAFRGEVPQALPSLGRAGQVGELAGMGLATGGMLAFPTGAVIAAQGKGDEAQKPNGGQRLGAIHPDLQKILAQGGVPDGRGGVSYPSQVGREGASNRFQEMGRIGIAAGSQAARDPLGAGGRGILNAVKSHPLVDAAIPDLNSLPSGFRQNKLLQMLHGGAYNQSAM